MSAFLRCVAQVALLSVAALSPFGPAPSAQQKIIEPPHKRPRPQCVEYPPELVGSFKQTLMFKQGGIKQTDVTNGRITWKKHSVKKEPPTSPWPLVNKFFEKARCPVSTYLISGGDLTVDTEVSYEGPMECEGRGQTSYEAHPVLFNMSILFIADNGYQLSIGAADTDMGKNVVTKMCKERGGRRTPFPPIEEQRNPNFIQIQDRSGTFVYGVHGEINPAISVSPTYKLTARWDFAAP